MKQSERIWMAIMMMTMLIRRLRSPAPRWPETSEIRGKGGERDSPASGGEAVERC